MELHENQTLDCKIAQRLPDVERKDIQKHVYYMAHTGELITTGNKTTRRYTLPA